MKIDIRALAASVLLAVSAATSHAAIVGPVNILNQINDGTIPQVCGAFGDVNANVGGVSEMSLDLDQDSVADVCFGSISNTCTAGFNYDAVSLANTRLMTTGFSIMNGTDATLTFWNGQSVGPFQGASGPIGSAPIGIPDVPMVFGFQGGSNSAPTDVGYFSFTVNSSDCSISFGSVDITANANTFSNAVVASAPTPAAIPTLSEWAMILMGSLMGLFAFTRIRRQS